MAERYDVIVCGAGMAGLCTAVAAQEAGARVLVIEKGPAPGGSMRMSGGTLWTAPSMTVVEEYVAGGDRVRQRQLVEGIFPGIDWLRGKNAPLGAPIQLERQVGIEFDVAGFTDRMVHIIEAGGGDVAVSTALDALDLDVRGRIAGVRTRSTVDGQRASVSAPAVVLATGGFQGNHELLARWIGRYADRMLRRANPNSTGDGLLAALAAGARTSPNLSTFYGHTMPAPPADPPASRWTAVTQYGSADTILVNERGERFFDESRSLADELAPSEIVQQPNGRAALLLDARIYDDSAPIEGKGRQPHGSQFDNAAAVGGLTVVADTLDALADGVAAWGFSRRGLLATIEEFNAAVAAGEGAHLRIPRTRSPFGLVKPPFRALLVRAAITFTNGGADVDEQMRVINRDGLRIPGLYAAGADAGGTWQNGYMGGLVLGLVQGRIAGADAAAHARSGASAAVA